MKSIWKKSHFKDVVKLGLQNSCFALADMLSDRVQVSGFTTSPSASIQLANYQIKSDIFGDFQANTMLGIDSKSCEKIVAKLLTNGYQVNDEMKEATLKELDNVLVASFVTKFAELLNCHIFGDVPSLAPVSVPKPSSFNKNLDSFQCKFVAKKSGIVIWFMCSFDENLRLRAWNHQRHEALIGEQKNRKSTLHNFFRRFFQKKSHSK